jgi:two-component system sensor histidine kinase ChiS
MEERPLVLCIDDDPWTVGILSKIMSRLPVRHLVATDPHAALETAQRERPHLLILDLMLPEISGWEVLDRIRSSAGRDDLRVIVLTAKDSSLERLIAANVARVDVFLTKPFDTSEFARHVLRLLGVAPGEGWPWTGPSTGPLAWPRIEES